jgi:hypothetical protein
MKSQWRRLLTLAFALATQFAGSPAIPQEQKTQKKMEEGNAAPVREVYGKVQSIKEAVITIQTRTGATLEVDSAAALKGERSAPIVIGHAICARGRIDKKGVLHAESIQRAKDAPAMWPADR